MVKTLSGPRIYIIVREGESPLPYIQEDGMSKNIRNTKGAGSFKKNPDGTVTHRKGVGYKPDGKRKTLTVTAATKTACIREMRKKEAEWNRQKAAAHIHIQDTIIDLCYSHLKYQIENGMLKSKSIDRRECTIENQIRGYDLAFMQIQAVTAVEIETHVNKLLAEKKVGQSSIAKTVDVLNAAFDWAIRRGDLDKNPVHIIKPELKKKIMKLSYKGANEADVAVLSDEEMALFVNEAMALHGNGNEKYSAGNYCLLLLYTGLRVGEMLALRWKDWEGEVLVIEKSISMVKNRNKKSVDDNNYIPLEGSTKNQKARIIQLTNEAKWILKRIRDNRKVFEQEDLIVVTRTGKLNTASNLEHRLKVIFNNAGLKDVKGGLHILRKTFATRMYENGARVEEIAAYIGDLESTTRKYYIAIRKKMRNGEEMKQVVGIPAIIHSDGESVA